MAAYLCKHNTCCEKKKLLRRYLAVIRETWNWADKKVSVSIELGFNLSPCQTSIIGDCHATLYSFSCKCESNLKPDFQLYNRNTFSPPARLVDFLPFFWEKTDFDCVIKNLVLNLSHIYRRMSAVPDTGCLTQGWNYSHLNWDTFNFNVVSSLLYHNTVLCLWR